MAREVVRVAKYGVVGVANTAVSFAVLYVILLLWPVRTETVMVLGSSIAYVAGGINSYWWNKNWTFGAGKSGWVGSSRFAVMIGVCLVINGVLVLGSSGWMASSLIPLWLVNGALQVYGLVAGVLGYLVLRLWVFKPAIT